MEEITAIDIEEDFDEADVGLTELYSEAEKGEDQDEQLTN